MTKRVADPIAAWFIAAEELGDYIGIRFGHLPLDTNQPEWIFLRHTDVDGIGGLAEILRGRGAKLAPLPQIKYPLSPSWTRLLRALPKYLRPRQRVKWGALERGETDAGLSGPPPAVAWHVFDETATTQIRRVCRKVGVTVNSFLLKHLTKAIRPSLEDQSSVVPWMIPVNIRGKVDRGRDTDVHTSYVGVKVRSYETVQDVHRHIYEALGSGEHWANWQAYLLGRFVTSGVRRYLLANELGMSQWNIGGFSNLGDWDPDKLITQPNCAGAWLFCPPTLSCQRLGAGCVTFQNRLSVTIQAHPLLTTSPTVPRLWIQNWVKEIEIDLASILERVALFSSAASKPL
jgi:hypothetical protein